MPIIEVTGLRKRYGDTIAVHDVSFAVERGEIFGILGPNGAGKTTTVECLSGLREADAGRVRILDLDPTHQGADLRRQVGVQLQDCQLPEKMTVREALQLYRACYPRPADTGRLVAELGLAAAVNTRFGKLSGGQRQRLSIALALIGEPQIAILDELTTGLDPQGRRETWELIEGIRDRGVTVVLVTHFMAEAERLCDRIAVIDAGRVVAIDTPTGLISRMPDGKVIQFRPSDVIDLGLLTELPSVRDARRHGAQVVVTGGGDVLQEVVSVLARQGVVARDLRVEQPNLDDAFLALIRTSGEKVTRSPS